MCLGMLRVSLPSWAGDGYEAGLPLGEPDVRAHLKRVSEGTDRF